MPHYNPVSAIFITFNNSITVAVHGIDSIFLWSRYAIISIIIITIGVSRVYPVFSIKDKFIFNIRAFFFKSKYIVRLLAGSYTFSFILVISKAKLFTSTLVLITNIRTTTFI